MTVFASSQGAIHPNCFYAFFVEQVDRLCDEISGFVEYGYDLVEQGGIFGAFVVIVVLFFLKFFSKDEVCQDNNFSFISINSEDLANSDRETPW